MNIVNKNGFLLSDGIKVGKLDSTMNVVLDHYRNKKLKSLIEWLSIHMHSKFTINIIVINLNLQSKEQPT